MIANPKFLANFADDYALKAYRLCKGMPEAMSRLCVIYYKKVKKQINSQ